MLKPDSRLIFKSSSKWALLNPPTTNPPAIDSLIIFKRLGKRKIFDLQNNYTPEKITSFYYLFDE